MLLRPPQEHERAAAQEPGDPPGIWTVRVAVKDVNRNVVLPLQSSFEVRER